MTERERLIQLLQSSHCVELWNHNTDDFIEPNPIEKLADYLLANGVIVPPVAIGTKVYYSGVESGVCVNGELVSYSLDAAHLWFNCHYDCGLNYWHPIEDFGKTVFLSREEAEKALERSRG